MKLSWHMQRVPDWAPPLARAQRLQWIKIVNPAPATNPFPGVPFACVRFWHDDRQDTFIRDGSAGGCRYVQEYLAQMRQHPYATCFETANEPDCNSNEGLANLNAYSLGAMRAAEVYGLRLCILNLAQGNPGQNLGETPEQARRTERWKLEQLAPAVRHAAENGHWVGLHTYWLPSAGIGPLDRWHSLGRAVWNVEQWFDLGVPRTLRVLINENGVDGLIQGRRQGWQIESNLAQYRRDVAAFEERARALPWLDAHMLFTVGFEPPWESYDHGAEHLRTIYAALPYREAPVSIDAHPAPVRRRFTPDTFREYVASLTIRESYSQIVMHHTARPTKAQWNRWGGTHWIGRSSEPGRPGEEGALERHYRSRGWERFPHVFAAEDGIWVLGDLRFDGAGVTGHNAGRRHIEVVGDYRLAPPTGATWANAVAVARALLEKVGLPANWQTITWHRALRGNTACPGDAFVAAMDRFIMAVADQDSDQSELIAQLTAAQFNINPATAFAAYAAPRGWWPISPEGDHGGYRGQIWYDRHGDGRYLVYAPIGDWNRVASWRIS